MDPMGIRYTIEFYTIKPPHIDPIGLEASFARRPPTVPNGRRPCGTSHDRRPPVEAAVPGRRSWLRALATKFHDHWSSQPGDNPLGFWGTLWVILSHIESYWVILSHIESYWVILSHWTLWQTMTNTSIQFSMGKGQEGMDIEDRSTFSQNLSLHFGTALAEHCIDFAQHLLLAMQIHGQHGLRNSRTATLHDSHLPCLSAVVILWYFMIWVWVKMLAASSPKLHCEASSKPFWLSCMNPDWHPMVSSELCEPLRCERILYVGGSSDKHPGVQRATKGKWWLKSWSCHMSLWN